MDGGAWWATVHGVARSRTQLSKPLVQFGREGRRREASSDLKTQCWRFWPACLGHPVAGIQPGVARSIYSTWSFIASRPKAPGELRASSTEALVKSPKVGSHWGRWGPLWEASGLRLQHGVRRGPYGATEGKGFMDPPASLSCLPGPQAPILTAPPWVHSEARNKGISW